MFKYRPARRLMVLALIALGSHALASPESSGDVMLQLLRERALVPANVVQHTQQWVRQVRDATSELVFSAIDFLGVPYRRGGSSPEHGFDCSGFTRHIFERSVGLLLPHRAEQQAHDAGLAAVSREQLVPGDLVFFNTMRRAFSHVGLYIGEGKFIHAPRTGGVVRVEDMNQSYWARRYNGARRAELPAAPADSADSIPSQP